jgi:hypothetical protein
MKNTSYAFALAGLAAFSLACSQPPAAPASPLTGSLVSGEANPDGSTLKVTAPAAVFPVGGQELDDNDPDLVITNVTAHFLENVPFSYVFEVFEEGELVYRSAPVPGGPNGQTSHETAELLDYDEDFTWRAYAVYQGHRGPMSETASFRTFNRFGPSCADRGSELAIVECRRAQYGTIPHDELPDFLAKVAYDLNAAGMEHAPYGRLLKDTGNNCHGYSCDIICAGQGSGQRQWDILIDEDDAQIPVWNRVGDSVSRPCEAVQ